MGRLVIDGSPDVDEHLIYGGKDVIRDQVNLLWRLRSERFDAVVDFMANPRSAFYTLITGAPQRLSFETARQAVYTQVLPRPGDAGYIVDGKLKLLEPLGIVATDRAMVLPWTSQHLGPLRGLGEAHPFFAKAPLRVVLSPTHRREPRRWPLLHYARLSDILVREWGASVLWLWGPGEEEVMDQVIALTKEPTLKAPRTSFREMAALVANCDLFVGNSNGPSHVAVAVDIPSFQIHGPTSGHAWCPGTLKHRFMKRDPIATVTVEEVWEKLLDMSELVQEQASRRRVHGIRTSWL
jgi:ADP-heptose:LPS heptosyltransferase